MSIWNLFFAAITRLHLCLLSWTDNAVINLFHPFKLLVSFRCVYLHLLFQITDVFFNFISSLIFFLAILFFESFLFVYPIQFFFLTLPCKYFFFLFDRFHLALELVPNTFFKSNLLHLSFFPFVLCVADK